MSSGAEPEEHCGVGPSLPGIEIRFASFLPSSLLVQTLMLERTIRESLAHDAGRVVGRFSSRPMLSLRSKIVPGSTLRIWPACGAANGNENVHALAIGRPRLVSTSREVFMDTNLLASKRCEADRRPTLIPVVDGNMESAESHQGGLT
eukprot:CAMPEP_0172581976 /NCGR_PEP_ID=MMETSP1068-20121228/1377_1 /TAXON_ID=35684 /ORGANISM="Pseudopedinella elastica, Strain CCMP716" /LENGTH=147 /DNA_ID=CAMNT_0013375149 /DNA_START=925 /DNA_END=1368 /DNA_ORIENTATION=-